MEFERAKEGTFANCAREDIVLTPSGAEDKGTLQSRSKPISGSQGTESLQSDNVTLESNCASEVSQQLPLKRELSLSSLLLSRDKYLQLAEAALSPLSSTPLLDVLSLSSRVKSDKEDERTDVEEDEVELEDADGAETGPGEGRPVSHVHKRESQKGRRG